MKIIYPKTDGGIAIMMLSPTTKLTLLEAGKKFVPAKTPFKIIDDDQIPFDDTFYDAWEADFSKPDGMGEHDSN